MARQKPASPYFKSVHSPPPSPTPTPISTPILPRYTRKPYINSGEMVNFSKLDTKALIEAAMAPTTSQLKHQPKQLTPYNPEEPKTFDTISRKRTRNTEKARLSDDSLFESNSSEDTFFAKPTKKKQKQVVADDDDEDYDVPKRQLRNKGKGCASIAEQIDDDDDADNATIFEPVKSTKPKCTTISHKPSSASSRKASMVPKRRKSLGTPVPNSLEDAHAADKELFRMKADGKPWKQIKVVWQNLMGKQIGDSTLSVRYCKMKENFEKSGGRDDMRILKFKAKVEAELEADKWDRVARLTEADGGKILSAREVRLRFKEIEKNGFQVSAANSDDGMPEVTEADMDAIDRELAGVRDVDGSSDLSDLEQSDLDMSMDFEREVREENREVEELTQAEQKLIESFGEANGLDDVDLDREGHLLEALAAEEGTLVGEGISKLDHEDIKDINTAGADVEQGGRCVVNEERIEF